MATIRRKSPTQILSLLGQTDAMVPNGEDIAGVCRALEISESWFHRWRNQYGGMKADDAKRLRKLEKENATLKLLLADAELEKAALLERWQVPSFERQWIAAMLEC